MTYIPTSAYLTSVSSLRHRLPRTKKKMHMCARCVSILSVRTFPDSKGLVVNGKTRIGILTDMVVYSVFQM